MSSFKNRWTPEQTKANRKNWARALRNGEYTQGIQTLQTADGAFCCLGVACDLFMKEFPELLAVELHTAPRGAGTMIGHDYRDLRLYNNADPEMVADMDNTHDFSAKNSGTCPTIVRQWLGLNTDAGSFTEYDGVESSLAQHNDNGDSFERIARIILHEPKGLIEN